jgi:uncharacterized protein (DUF433 family)
MDQIIANPLIRFGKPIIKGTRLTVDEILGALAGGMSMEEVSQEYGLNHEQILAALRFATSWSEREVVADYDVLVGR